MSRNYGLMAIAGNFEIQYQGPIDGRTVVSTYADLTDNEVFKSTDGVNYIYKGIIVSVVNDTTSTDDYPAGYLNGSYILLGSDHTNPDNWSRISLSSIDGLIDYRTTVTNYPSINGVAITGDMTTQDFGFEFLTSEVVDELPPIADAERNVVYFAPATIEGEQNYEEWMIKEIETTYSKSQYDSLYPAATYPDQCYISQYEDPITGDLKGPYIRTWEEIGLTNIDLSDYYKKDEVDELVAYYDRDSSGNIVDGATDPDTYNAGVSAKKSYVTVGSVPSGTVMNASKMQEVVNDLFFAVLEPVVTSPSGSMSVANESLNVSMGETIYLEVSYEANGGTVTLDGEVTGTYSGDLAAPVFMINNVIHPLVDGKIAYTPAVSGTYVNLTGSIIYAAGQPLYKTDGTSSTVPTCTAGVIQFEPVEIFVLPFAYDCAGETETTSIVPASRINMEEKYIECELAGTTPQKLLYSTSFGSLLGVKQYNGFLRDYDYVCGSAAGSLTVYQNAPGDTSDVMEVTYVGPTAGARTVRLYFA